MLTDTIGLSSWNEDEKQAAVMQVRPCTQPGDFDQMRRILIDGLRASPDSGYVHLGDLNWWLFYLLGDCDLDEIAYLWQDASGLTLGWSLFSPRYSAFDLFVRPEIRQDVPRIEKMLRWTEQQAARIARQRHESYLYNLWVFEDDRTRMDLLEKCGFTRDTDYLMYFLVHPLESLAAPQVPDGFALRHVEGEQDIPSRAAAHRAAFQSGGLTSEAYRDFQHAPDYRADLDRVAVSPEGKVVAYVMGWLDADNRIGELEPIGVHPDYQRQGLGRAVILDTLRELKAQGAERAFLYVEHHNLPARTLYASVGFRQVNRIFGYMKAV